MTTTPSSIRGNWATLLLPINRDESIDFGLLEAELDHFIGARVDGIYSNGSAGEFYAQTEAAAPIPLVLYNPPHAKRRLSPPEWSELIGRTPAIVGIKVPGGDEAWYRAMRPVLERVSVFIPGHTLATGMARGAHGAYSNVACLSPRGAQEWSDECGTDLPAALAREARIQAFWHGCISPLITQRALPNMAADKAAAAAGGWLPGLSPRLRWPYRSADEPTVRAIAAEARRQLPEFFPGA